MTKKIGDKKIGGVKGGSDASKVEESHAVGLIKGVKAVSDVNKTGAVQATARRATRTMTLEEREQIFKLIDEVEAEMFGGPNGLPKEKRGIIASAAKMAIDSGLISKKDEEVDLVGKKKR